MLEEWKKEWHSIDKGRHLHRIDNGFPSKANAKDILPTAEEQSIHTSTAQNRALMASNLCQNL